MSNPSKCNMAYHRYCRKASLGYCGADELELKNCPYLQAIEELAKVIVEKSLLEDDGK